MTVFRTGHWFWEKEEAPNSLGYFPHLCPGDDCAIRAWIFAKWWRK